jgi:hypothetical protein
MNGALMSCSCRLEVIHEQKIYGGELKPPVVLQETALIGRNPQKAPYR